MRRLLFGLFFAILVLTGCKTTEEKVDELYQSGLTMVAAGNTDSAMAEFRSALRLDPTHRGARLALAGALLGEGQAEQAYAQYVSVTERFPDDIEARLSLAEISITSQNWEEAERQGQEALKQSPSDPQTKAIQAAVAHNAAVLANDEAAKALAVSAALAVLGEMPENLTARRVVIHSLLSGSDPAKALPEIEIAIALTPESLEFHLLKLDVLSRDQNSAAAGDQLKRMQAKFPDNPDIREKLYDWYIAEGDNDHTLAFLRDLALRGGNDPEPHLRVVKFIRDTEGADAALEELSHLAESATDTNLSDQFRAFRALIAFGQGRETLAISMLKEVIANAKHSKQANAIKVTLAKILAETGDLPGARALIDEVLLRDKTQIDALKLRAEWFLGDDKPREALETLRIAADLNPEDSDLLIMLAKAYESDGSAALAARNLALAVEVSENGATESVLFYEFLTRTGRPEVAHSVLVTALQANPGDIELLALGAERASAVFDWRGAEKLIGDLKVIGRDDARAAAATAEATLRRRKESSDKMLEALQRFVDEDSDVSAHASILRSLVEAGKLDQARTYLDERLAIAPTNPDFRKINEDLHSLQSYFSQPEQ